ncbi:MAG: hypothetical protein ACLR13_08990 [Acutalibacteraceae bacterium]
MKGRLLTIILAVTLFLLAVLSLFVGVIDINLSSLFSGEANSGKFSLFLGYLDYWQSYVPAWA